VPAEEVSASTDEVEAEPTAELPQAEEPAETPEQAEETSEQNTEKQED
jgi:hypothetical protein